MIKLFSVIKNIFSIEELRSRILTTVGFLIIFRLGSFVVLPGIDPSKLQQSASGIFGLLDTFLGGAFSNASIFALGIMPYISASIVVQLLGVSLPYFQKLQKEGDSGRKKMTQITRYLTIIITIFQSTAYISGTIPAEAILVQNKFLFTLSCIVILTSGTIFCMWIGEKITDKGIGNGISMLIMIGIISRFPGSIVAEALSRGMSQALLFIVEISLFTRSARDKLFNKRIGVSTIEKVDSTPSILFNPSTSTSLLLTYSALTCSKYETSVFKAASPAICPNVGGDNLA